MNENTQENNIQKVDLEVISRETIKPTSPTPHHLRTFNLSIIDNIVFDVYTPLILFLPNTNKASVTDVVTKRSKHLKEALSQTLTQFYPVAGKIMDNLHIKCNDEGVYYKETRVNQALNDFLSDPDDPKVRELIPEHPRTSESSVGNFLLGVQVNIFSCGGIGIGTSMSHKILDGETYYTFMKAWAEAARGSPQTISPSFVASKIFPGNPCKDYSVSSKFLTSKRTTTKRFVFNSNVLTLLKAQTVACSSSSRAPTRMEATTAVIWKAAAKAASTVRSFSPQLPYALLPVVSLRERASPPLPSESFGNLIFVAGAICLPERQPDLPTLMGELRESIAKLNTHHIESMKGEKGHKTFDNLLKNVNHLAEVTREGDCLFASSLLNSGMYELDFGWGKPIWFYAMNAGLCRFLHLNDMLKGGGVEAIVTLSPEEMEIFERDPELLSFAAVNPSPLQFLNN
ncbi:vinorine synthase-like protein [Tanacetum coccineum]